MKIALFCSSGMSTSIIVSKMKEHLTENEKNWIIEARPVDSFKEIYENYDLILLAPQMRYKIKTFQNLTESAGIPISVIDTLDYGMGNGEKILEESKKILKEASYE